MKGPRLNQQQQSYIKLSPQNRQKRLNALKHWQIQGAVSIRQPQQSFIAAYTWYQRQHHYSISLHSSLDLASIKLTGKPGQVTLTDAKGHVTRSSNLDQLMRQQLGWSLPVQKLNYWIRGLKAPGSGTINFNQLGQTQRIQQLGWDIHYNRYQRIRSLELPTLLDISGHQLHIRIVIKHWQF